MKFKFFINAELPVIGQERRAQPDVYSNPCSQMFAFLPRLHSSPFVATKDRLVNTTWGIAIIMLIAFIVVCNAADPIYNFEDFSGPGTSSWTNDHPAQVEISNKDNRLNAEHLAQSAPDFVEDVVKMPIVAGSYITDISFRLGALDYKPSKLRLQFHASGSDTVWSLNLPPPEAGSQIVVDQPLTFSAGWSIGADSPEAQFNNDLWSIDWVGISIRRNADIAEQNYYIDDFLVQGLFYIVDNDADKIADSWEVAHGLNSNDVHDAQLDRDGDGVSNYEEYRAGTDPNDSDSMFWAKIDKVSSGGETVGFELRWDSTTNRTYTVWRATDLNGSFTKFAEGVHSTPPENIYRYPASTNSPAYFYQIEVDPEL